MEAKECNDQQRLKTQKTRSMPERGRCFSMDWATLFGTVAEEEERLAAAERN